MSIWSAIASIFGFGASNAKPPSGPTPMPNPQPVPPGPVPPKPTKPAVGLTPIYDLIGKGEGTLTKPNGQPARGYDETLAYGAYDPPQFAGRPITTLTLDELDRFQTLMLSHPRNKLNSSACGKYQIVRTTMRDLRRQYNLDGNRKFDAKLQDTLCAALLERRGFTKWKNGEIKTGTFMDNLAHEWASLPGQDGRGKYSGQRTGVTVNEVITALYKVLDND